MTDWQDALKEYHYKDFQETPHGIICLAPFLFTWAIMISVDEYGYGYRYCFHTLLEAKSSLQDWKDNNYKDEPEGYIVRKGLG